MDEGLQAPPLRSPLANTSFPREGEPDPADVERVRKWHEERLARKLRGEYESSMFFLSELIKENLDSPLTLASVRVNGATHTRQTFLDWLIRPHLASSTTGDLSTVSSVLKASREISNSLKSADIFSSLEPSLVPSQSPLAKTGDVDLVFKAREKGRYFLKTSTQMGDGEGSAGVQARVRNVFGGAEQFDVNVALGTRTRRSFDASFTAPIAADLRSNAQFLVYGLERDHTAYASCQEEAKGLKATIRHLSRSGVHELTYETVHRQIGNLSTHASLGIREAAGPSTKSALSHSWVHDSRDDLITATRGCYLKSYQELAGLGGSTSFYKAQGALQICRRIIPSVSLSFALRTGFLVPLSSKPTPFPDRFHLGGPLDVRGFRHNSLGPCDRTDYIGGDLFWAAGLSLISDLPFKPQWPLKAHAFVNAGRLDTRDKSQTLAQNVVSCVTKPCISAGLGLIYRYGPIRVEFNFGIPLVANATDGVKKGLQIGMGIDYL